MTRCEYVRWLVYDTNVVNATPTPRLGIISPSMNLNNDFIQGQFSLLFQVPCNICHDIYGRVFEANHSQLNIERRHQQVKAYLTRMEFGRLYATRPLI
jgi:hypothetical protein